MDLLINMKNTIKRLDQEMVFMLVLWLASVNFNQMSTLSWISGGAIVAYLLFFAVRR